MENTVENLGSKRSRARSGLPPGVEAKATLLRISEYVKTGQAESDEEAAGLISASNHFKRFLTFLDGSQEKFQAVFVYENEQSVHYFARRAFIELLGLINDENECLPADEGEIFYNGVSGLKLEVVSQSMRKDGTPNDAPHTYIYTGFTTRDLQNTPV